ncbi:MAG: 3-deoxy-8-phosphooctulonate synthase [Planctomycetota bacterium]|nr:3-deoxy-8-phosphooctulonate synthase [Planctomycetota bacterium]
MNNPVKIGEYGCGQGCPLLLIGGPCVIEDEDVTLQIGETLLQRCNQLGCGYLFKASFDKANRTSGTAFRGLGLDQGLAILEKVKARLGIEVTTDIHQPGQAEPVAEVCSVLQIPAFLARQTDLIVAAATTGKVVNVKKGQFMSPPDMKNVAQKIVETGNRNVLLCERGTFFGYGNLVNDMRAIPQMQEIGAPVVFDATHSVQQPGGLGHATGGNREMVDPLARAAVAIGADAIFMETHPDPDQSPSDGANMIPLDKIDSTLSKLVQLRETILGWQN